MRAAVIQLDAGNDKYTNISRVLGLITKAAQKGAKLVVLPEVFNFRGAVSYENLLSRVAEKIPGESIAPLMELAQRKKVAILAGSVYEKVLGKTKVYNSSVLIDPRGKIVAKYRKQNLFDAVVDKKIIKESQIFLTGDELATADMSGFRIGLTICYDVRFPSLYRDYSRRGCNVLTIPSVFTKMTGEAHWETLLRARAIENLSYVLAPNQIGRDGRGVESYGNSMIIGPWGNVLARASANREEIIFATLDQEELRNARNRLPGICKK